MALLSPPIRVLLSLAALGSLGLGGCASGPTADENPPTSAPATIPSLSLYEQRLLNIIEDEQNLVAVAFAETGGPVNERQVQRRFQALAADYTALIADNPDELDARLLYGKFLAQFGDREGAHEQFSFVWRREPDIAVVNQQLGAYLAEEGQFVDAMGFYLRAVELAPEEAAYHYDVGELLATFRPGFITDGVFLPEQIEREMLAAFQRAADLAPDQLPLQLRYGEAFYDLSHPDWTVALAHWETVQNHPALSVPEAEAVRLHRARCLAELGRTLEARALVDTITQPGLFATRDTLIAEFGL